MAQSFRERAELFSERFPRYGLLLPEWIAQARVTEEDEETQRTFRHIELPAHTEVLYLYGLCEQIPLEVREWLGTEKKRRLVFLEPSSHWIVRFLQQGAAHEILKCEQISIVHLSMQDEVEEILQWLAEEHPVRGVHIELFSILKADAFESLKQALLRKTAFTYAHHLERLHGHIPFSHLVRNVRRIPDAFYANDLKDVFKGVPAIVCGAGPSLTGSVDALRALENRALILAGGSAITALSHHGVMPHFCLAIDPNSDELDRMKNSSVFEVPFLFCSRVHPDCFSACNGPFGYLRSGMAGIPELWFEEQLGLSGPILGEKLPDEALSVTALAAAFAYHIGCDPILFEGVDLAYAGERRYADGVVPGGVVAEGTHPIDRLVVQQNEKGEQVQSAVRWVMEADALAALVRNCPDRRWMNCTRGGLGLKGVEVSSLSTYSFLHEWDLRERVHRALVNAPMPPQVRQAIEEKGLELKNSLDRTLSLLEQLVSEKRLGLRALAELDLKEELAYLILLFEAEKAIRIVLGDVDEGVFWQAMLELATRYRQAMNAF